jgi:hypothetical protein
MRYLELLNPRTQAQRVRQIWASSFQIEDEIDLLFARGNPNQKREGCLRLNELLAMARRQFPVGDPRYEHLARCSPCFCELRGIQQRNAFALAVG